MVSKFMADVVFGKETDVINFVYNNRSLGQKIKDWIVDTLGITRKEGENDVLITAKRNFEKALSDTSADIDSIDNVQYDISKSFSEQVDDYLSKKMRSNDVFYLGTENNVLKAVGTNDNPIIMTQKTFDKAMQKHNLTSDMIKRVYDQIKSPVMILKSDTVDDALVIVTEIKNKNGQSIIVPLHLDKKERFRVVDIITSIYGKKNEEDFLTEQILRDNLLYYEKNKANRLLRSRGLQLPKLNTTISSDIILPPNGVVVNTIIRSESNIDTRKYDIGESFKEIKPEANKAIGADKTSTQSIANDEDMGYKENDINQLLELSTCTKDELTNYLHKIDDINNTNYSDEFIANSTWLDKIQIPKSSYVLNSDSTINWSQAPKGGYILDNAGNAIKDEYIPKVGEIIDRYGESNGRYVSPVVGEKSYTFTQRSLPYIENLANYHRYEVIGDFTKIKEYIFNCPDLKVKAQADAYITKYYDGDYNGLIAYYGKVAKIDGWGTGGANQYELPLEIELLVKLRLLKEL